MDFSKQKALPPPPKQNNVAITPYLTAKRTDNPFTYACALDLRACYKYS
jgi:hypothetical protein